MIDQFRRKGMRRLVNTQPDVMREQSRAWLAGQTTAENLNPLVVTMLEINQKARECAAHIDSPIAEYCPLCEAERVHQSATLGVQWADNCTDAVLLLCYANGVLKPS